MRFKINLLSWIVFLGLLFHMADARKPQSKYIIAKKTDLTPMRLGI